MYVRQAAGRFDAIKDMFPSYCLYTRDYVQSRALLYRPFLVEKYTALELYALSLVSFL